VAALFALGALSIAGMPPAAGFVGKLQILRAVIGDPILAAVVLLGSLLSFVYAFQIYQFERWRPDTDSAARRGVTSAQVVPLALGGLILGMGVWPEPLLVLSNAAAAVLSGAP
jgi:multicomponent Na+:H+ antiporter subunit D